MTGNPADAPMPGGPAGPAGPAGPVGPSGIDLFFERLRRLGVARATQGKVAGGVCAGLARRWNIDPLVARLVFVVLTVFGGFGLLAYLVALAMLPDEKGTIFAEEALRRRHGGAIFLVFIIAVMTVGEFFDRWWVWLAIPLALAAWWIVRGAAAGKSPRQLGSEAKTHAAEAADAVRGWGAATPPTPAPPLSAPYQPTYQAPPPYQPYQATPVSHATPTSPAADSPWGHLPQDHPAPMTAPHGMGPGRTWSPAPQAPAPLVVREKRRRGGFLVFITALGLAAITTGTLSSTNALGDRVAQPALFAVIAGCAVAALVLFVVALRGMRAPFTAFLLTLVLAVSAAAAFVPNPVGYLAGAGERSWTPVSGTGSTAYALGFGEGTLDLKGISPTADTTAGLSAQQVSVQLGFGELVVIVPDGVTARINLAIGAGDVIAEQPGGADPSSHLYSGGAGQQTYLVGTGSPDVVVNVSVGFGSVRLQSTTAPSVIRDGVS